MADAAHNDHFPGTPPTERMKPAQVLDHQVDLVHWYGTRRGQFQAQVFLERGAVETVDGKIVGGGWDTTTDLAGALRSMLDLGETFYVTEDMETLIEHAARTMPSEKLNVAYDVPFDAGFVWLQRALYIRDLRGQINSVKAISWHRRVVDVGYAPPEIDDVIAIGDRKRRTEVAQKMLAKVPVREAMTVLIAFWSDGDDPNEAPDYLESKRAMIELGVNPPRLDLLHVMPWASGLPSYHPEGMIDADGNTIPPELVYAAAQGTASVQNFLRAFWIITRQKIATVKVETADRATRRRLERKGWPRREVSVVNLRRSERAAVDGGDESEPRHVNWSHRWLVSGHWRRQWCPSIKDHRNIYINPYVKGPEDRPFDPGDRVFQVKQ